LKIGASPVVWTFAIEALGFVGLVVAWPLHAPVVRAPLIANVDHPKELVDSDKVESIRFEFLVDPSNPATRFSKEFFIFKDRSPEEYIRWLIGFRDVELLMPLKEPSDRTKMLHTMLKGRAHSLFEYHP
jgi:hypothetical protein